MLNLLKSNPFTFIGILAVIIMFLFTPSIILVIIIIAAYLGAHFYEKMIKERPRELDITQSKKSGQHMSHEAKEEYFKSPQWKLLRILVLQRDHYECKTCGSKHKLQIHHITYKNLGKEHLDELATLCGDRVENGKLVEGCHSKIHRLLGYGRNKDYPISFLKNLP